MIIDRFEGDFAVCENDGAMISIEKRLLPPQCREGDKIILENGTYVIADNTADRERIKKKMNALFKH